MGSSCGQCAHIGRTHDGPVTHERLMVVLDAVMVVEIVDHDAEGFLDRTACGVAEPIDPFEPRAVAEGESALPGRRGFRVTAAASNTARTAASGRGATSRSALSHATSRRARVRATTGCPYRFLPQAAA